MLSCDLGEFGNTIEEARKHKDNNRLAIALDNVRLGLYKGNVVSCVTNHVKSNKTPYSSEKFEIVTILFKVISKAKCYTAIINAK